MRLFISINLSQHTRTKLLYLQNELRFNSTKGYFTLPGNFHITLVFIGDCCACRASHLCCACTVSLIKAEIELIEFDPFYIIINRIDRFKRDYGDIWWAGIESNHQLQELHNNITENLLDKKVLLKRRDLKPHITLGRKIKTDVLPRQIKPFNELVTGITLVESEFINGKLTYTII